MGEFAQSMEPSKLAIMLPGIRMHVQRMTPALILLLTLPLFLVGAFLVWRRQILANRAPRVLVGLMLVPLVLFCGFGFLASFEGNDGSFIAFRAGYAVLAGVLAIGSGWLIGGKLRPSSR